MLCVQGRCHQHSIGVTWEDSYHTQMHSDRCVAVFELCSPQRGQSWSTALGCVSTIETQSSEAQIQGVTT